MFQLEIVNANASWHCLHKKETVTRKTVPEMTYNVFSGTLNPTHFTSLR